MHHVKGLVDSIDWTRATDAFLAQVAKMTEREAESATGVSASTLRRWRMLRKKGMPIGEPRGKPKDALLRAIEKRSPSEQTPPYDESREELELARIGALPDPLLRSLERESMAAVIRAQGMRDACRAARIEAEKAPDRSAARYHLEWTEQMSQELERLLRERREDAGGRRRERRSGDDLA